MPVRESVSNLRNGVFFTDIMQLATEMTKSLVNPFTASACKVSGLKSAQTRLLTIYFMGFYNKSNFNMCVLIKILSHSNARKEKKKA